MARYGYASFFAVMAGGVAAGITGVAIDALWRVDPSWAPVASASVGLVSALAVFATVLRLSGRGGP